MYTVQEQEAIKYALNIIKSKANDNVAFTSASSVMDYLHLKLGTEEREVFNVCFLNAQNVLIESENMFSGTIDQSAVFPREIVKRALQLNARNIIIAHNHPSGIAEPSRADRNITELIKSACDLLDIRVLDHIIVGSKSCYSFAESGLL